MNKSRLVRLSIVVAIVTAGIMLYLVLANNKSDDTSGSKTTDTSTPATYSGTIQAIDIEGMATDGAGLYELQTEDGTIVVALSSGESACDTTAIQIPDLKIGDRAEARGISNQSEVLQVCEAGTYLKKI